MVVDPPRNTLEYELESFRTKVEQRRQAVLDYFMDQEEDLDAQFRLVFEVIY